MVGVAGVSGNGQKELLYALSGEDTRADASMIQVFGQAAARMGPGARRALGVHFVPDERLGRGAVTFLLLLVGLRLLLGRTKLGLAFRAVSSNLSSSRLTGIRVGPTLQFGWALAAALGTLGAALVAPRLNLEPGFMAKLVIFAFAAATLGGLDSINGAVIGAFVIAAEGEAAQPVLDALRRQAVQDGMRPLRLAGAARVAEGLTTMDEVLACTPPVQ